LINVEFTLRKFEPRDLDIVMYINRTTLPENYTSRFFMEHHERFPEAFLVAEVEGNVVGYVMSRVELGLGCTVKGIIKKGHIVSIAVLPDYRRRGIGSKLLEQAMEALKDIYGCKEVYLEVRVSNNPAISLYEKYGFRKVKIIRGYYLDGEDAYIMARPLIFTAKPI